MAKNKKKGFFSWLGFGQKEQEQPQQDVEQQAADAEQAAVAPVAEEVVEHIAEPEAEVAAHSHEGLKPLLMTWLRSPKRWRKAKSRSL